MSGDIKNEEIKYMFIRNSSNRNLVRSLLLAFPTLRTQTHVSPSGTDSDEMAHMSVPGGLTRLQEIKNHIISNRIKYICLYSSLMLDAFSCWNNIWNICINIWDFLFVFFVKPKGGFVHISTFQEVRIAGKLLHVCFLEKTFCCHLELSRFYQISTHQRFQYLL